MSSVYDHHQHGYMASVIHHATPRRSQTAMEKEAFFRLRMKADFLRALLQVDLEGI